MNISPRKQTSLMIFFSDNAMFEHSFSDTYIYHNVAMFTDLFPSFPMRIGFTYIDMSLGKTIRTVTIFIPIPNECATTTLARYLLSYFFLYDVIMST
jgi:hypothetical protein